MALTDEQVKSLRDLGQLGTKILELQDRVKKVTGEITALRGKRDSLLSQLQSAKETFQTEWEALRQG